MTNPIKKHLLSVLLVLTGFMACSQVSQKANMEVEEGVQEELIGILSHHQWSKSTTSYCAGGSDYWTLNTEHDEYGSIDIVIPADKDMAAAWAEIPEGEPVVMWGKYKKVERKESDDGPISQRPSGGDFECFVFEVNAWEILGSTEGEAEEMQIVGLLQHRQWSKSITSYCAGGSDYWTVAYTTSDEREIKLVVIPANEEMKAAWLAMDGKSISLWGVYREIEKDLSDSDPMSQHPLGGDVFNCTVFDVMEWEEME